MRTLAAALALITGAFMTSAGGTASAPAHEVVYLTSDYRTFLESARAEDDVAAVYQRLIPGAMWSEHFRTSEYADLVRGSLVAPIKDLAGLQRSIERVDTAEAEVRQRIAAALGRLAQDFDPSGLTFYVLPANPESRDLIERMDGVVGMTAGSNQILLTIDPAVEGWQAMLEYAVAHEFAHAFWTRQEFGPNMKWTLLDYLVFEGRADYLAQQYYPTMAAPWTQALSSEEKSALWTKIRPHLDSEDFNHQLAIMFGSPDYPAWGGYSLGFDLVRQALADTPLKAAEWLTLDSRQLLEMSQYGMN